jgi:hypothetical protein
METMLVFACHGGKKFKKHPTDPLKDHTAYYFCVQGDKKYEKVKLYHNKGVAKMMTKDMYRIDKEVEEVSKLEAEHQQ